MFGHQRLQIECCEPSVWESAAQASAIPATWHRARSNVSATRTLNTTTRPAADQFLVKTQHDRQAGSLGNRYGFAKLNELQFCYELTMPTTDLTYMRAHFSTLDDAALLDLLAPGALTDIANTLVRAELDSRGVAIADAHEAPAQAPDLGEFQTLQHFLEPIQAHMLAACLQDRGIPAFVADADMVQTNMLLSIALGGVRLQVPEALFERAQAIMESYDRGDFALKDPEDDGEKSESGDGSQKF